jgi:signal transduction histidine kinase
VLDVTRRKQEEERLRASDERHVRLWERALVAQDEERRRIARELHDQAGAAMASLLVACRLLEGAGTLEDARERARRLAGDIATVLDDLARLARGLHPVALDEIGLDAALSRGIAGLAELHALEVSVDVALGDAPIAPEVELALYRIAQEAMTNVINHADASRVTLVCHRQGDEVLLALADDGRGFDAGAADEQVRLGRLGLAGIRDRAALLGGGLVVTSRPGAGTRVEVRIPAVPAAR